MDEKTNIEMVNWARELMNDYNYGDIHKDDLPELCDRMVDFLTEFIKQNQ